MMRLLYLLGTIVVGLLFGFALTSIEPYPHNYGDVVWLAGAALFLVVAVSLRSSRARLTWAGYGLTIFGCFAVAEFWFWFGAMNRGWWYPPQPPIVQLFFFVDGEAGYDAQVGNLFIVLWFFVSALFAIRYLTRRCRHDGPDGPQPELNR